MYRIAVHNQDFLDRLYDKLTGSYMVEKDDWDLSPFEIFHNRNISDEEVEHCLLWRFGVRGGTVPAVKLNDYAEEIYNAVLDVHVLVWMIFNRSIPEVGSRIMHICKVPVCCNPHHLYELPGGLAGEIVSDLELAGGLA